MKLPKKFDVKINFKIHDKNHLVKNCLGYFDFLYNPFPKDELIVLNYHGVSSIFFENFKRQIDYFASKYNFIGPKEFHQYYKHQSVGSKPSILLTFDDGIKNNYAVAKYLHERGIHAFFFVVPDFVDCSEKEQKNFYVKNIRPITNTYVEMNDEDFQAMSWDQLRDLVGMGHELGAHTSSHTLRATCDLSHSEYEIVNCKPKMVRGLNLDEGAAPTSFCSIVDSLLSVGKKEADLIAKNYSYHFTTFPGSNVDRNPLFVHRVNVEAHWLRGAARYACSTLDQKRWKDHVKAYNTLL